MDDTLEIFNELAEADSEGVEERCWELITEATTIVEADAAEKLYKMFLTQYADYTIDDFTPAMRTILLKLNEEFGNEH